MKKYVCQKPCNFGGRQFIIGEEVPAEMIDPARVNTLLKYGTITSVDIPDAPPAPQDPDVPPEQPPEDTETPGQTEDTETPEQPPEGTEQPDKEPSEKTGKKGGRK